jgi:hypothetical protein
LFRHCKKQPRLLITNTYNRLVTGHTETNRSDKNTPLIKQISVLPAVLSPELTRHTVASVAHLALALATTTRPNRPHFCQHFGHGNKQKRTYALYAAAYLQPD